MSRLANEPKIAHRNSRRVRWWFTPESRHPSGAFAIIIISCHPKPACLTRIPDRQIWDQNTVFFRKAKGGRTIAVTYIWYIRTTGIIIEFDMLFYDGWKYFSFDGSCSSARNGGFYLSVIAAHEFGHAIGLDHNGCTDSIMYPYADYCDTNLVQNIDKDCADTIY